MTVYGEANLLVVVAIPNKHNMLEVANSDNIYKICSSRIEKDGNFKGTDMFTHPKISHIIYARRGKKNSTSFVIERTHRSPCNNRDSDHQRSRDHRRSCASSHQLQKNKLQRNKRQMSLLKNLGGHSLFNDGGYSSHY
jgi:hypothetical protein